MIAEALAGKRIAVTGATGFLGTALVERLLRSRPRTARSSCWSGPGRRARRPSGSRREILRNDCFDRLRRELGRPASTPRSARRVRPWPATSATDGLGLDDDGRERAAPPATSSSTPPPPSASTRRSTRPSRSTCSGPSRVAAATAGTSRPGSRRPPRSPSRPPTWPAPGGATPPRRCCADTPFATEVDWRAEVAAARRPRADADADSRDPEQLARFAKAGPGASSARPAPRCWPTRPSGSARSGSTTALVEAGQGPGPGARLARRLRLHQGPGRAGPARDPRRRARHHRAAVDHRVGPGRARARAGSAASAWPSRSSSPTPGACSRSSPACPRASSTSSRSTWWWRAILAVAADGARPGRARPSTTSASGARNPLRYRPAGRPGPGLVHRAPALRHRRPAHRRARVVVPRPGPGAAPAAAGDQGAWRRPRRLVAAAAGPGPPGRAGRPPRGAARPRPSGPSATSSSTAPTPRPRPSSGSTACSTCGTALDADDQADFCFDPASSTGPHYVPRRPPAVGRRARPGADDQPGRRRRQA